MKDLYNYTYGWIDFLRKYKITGWLGQYAHVRCSYSILIFYLMIAEKSCLTILITIAYMLTEDNLTYTFT